MESSKKPYVTAHSEHSNRKQITIYIVIATVLLICGGYLISLDLRKDNNSATSSKILMGTLVQIAVGTEKLSEAEAREVAEKAFLEIERLENILSSYKKESDVSRINSGVKEVLVSKETMEVLKVALRIAELSGGAFDPSAGPLIKLWNINSDEEKTPPTESEIKEGKKNIGYKKITVNEEKGTVSMEKGMRLNLGGVAKGYIVKRALEVLKANDVDWAIIKAGGDMTLYKDPTHAEPFTVGVQDPRSKRGITGTILIDGGAVASSGDYERFFELEGKRYHHIIDPATGYPALGTMGVTIISSDPTLADAVSTAVFVLGAKKSIKLIERLDKVEGLVIDDKKKVHLSSGLKEKYTPYGVEKKK